MRVAVQKEEFEIGLEIRKISKDKSIGAIASFIGQVRDVAMTLEHYPGMTEKAIGEFILDWFARHDIKTVRQEISPERLNAVGIVEGKSNGASLTINGHMDTSYTGTEEDRMFCRVLEPDSDLKGAVRDLHQRVLDMLGYTGKTRGRQRRR